MGNSNSIRAIAENRLAYETDEFRKDFESGDMARNPERYFRACRGMFMFRVWEGYIDGRNQESASGKGCTIQEFVSLLESRGYTVTPDVRPGRWKVTVGQAWFTLSPSDKGNNYCIIHAYSPEFEWSGGMYSPERLGTSLTDAESLIDGFEEFDTVDIEIMARLAREITHWKKMLLAKQIEDITEEARK